MGPWGVSHLDMTLLMSFRQCAFPATWWQGSAELMLTVGVGAQVRIRTISSAFEMQAKLILCKI